MVRLVMINEMRIDVDDDGGSNAKHRDALVLIRRELWL